MKLIYSAFLFFLLLIPGISTSQIIYKWYEIPGGTSSDLNAIFDYVIIGNNGIILTKTSSQGWTIASTGTIKNLHGIIFRTNTFPIVCGDSGVLLTAFGNINNWIPIQSGTIKNLYSISKSSTAFPVILRYIAAGEKGTIISSTDNGANWTAITSPVNTDLKSVYFIQNTNAYFKCGWIAGDNGVILKTTDGGGSWVIKSSGLTQNLQCIAFRDSLAGIAAGDNGMILKSTDKGETWIQKQSGTTKKLNSVFFYGTSVWVTGESGLLLNSTNLGESWTEETNFTNTNLNSFYYGNFNTPIVVGDSGKIYNRQIDSLYLASRKISPNNTSAYYCYRGIFDQNNSSANSPGFEWPKGSGKYAVFTAGLSISALIYNHLAQTMASYSGEFQPGYTQNCQFFTDNKFKIYIVKKGDNAQTNPDWANWGLMIPFGAPFIDVNNNKIYEPAIDTPGVKNAEQTLFLCYTDANPNSHRAGEGFGGGITSPLLFSEIHLTAWGYNQTNLRDVQFIKWVIINKDTAAWNKVFMSIVCDPDLGDVLDDYIGCDTTRNLSFCYNSDNNDAVYGANPPAVGIRILKSPRKKIANPPYDLGFTSYTRFHGYSPCEYDPNGEPYPAYLLMQGFKKDSTCWMDVSQSPPKKTKFIYAGDPETNTGWTEFKGSMANCNRDTTGIIYSPNISGDRKYVMSFGAYDFSVLPNDTQTIIAAQIIARGSNNLNSVTMLKLLADSVLNFYNTYLIDTGQYYPSVPVSYYLEQNYPNPFNNKTLIRFQIPDVTNVKLVIYDILGREMKILVNEVQQPGYYEVTFDGTDFASGIYFYRLQTDNFSSVKRMALIK